MNLIVGMTGGPGTGKSTVLRMLGGLGAETLDVDLIVHKLLRPETRMYRRIVRFFGRDILKKNREIDRRLLGKAVFSEPPLRKKLEDIIHPPVIREMRETLRLFKRKRGILVLEVPLLYEKELKNMFDKIIVVSSSQKAQRERLRKDLRLPLKEIMMRIGSQMSLRKKEKLADYVIKNSSTLSGLKKKVKSIWSEIRQGQEI